MIIKSPLEFAILERVSADPAKLPLGRFYYRTDTDKFVVKLSGGVDNVAFEAKAQSLTNKDIDGGTASNSSRITVPKNTIANLTALTRKAGTVVYATDTQLFYYDDGSNLKSLSTDESGFSTGDVKLTIKTVADSGWVLMNDTTIGNASSGATGRANADTENLFTLLWNNTVNANCAVSGGRGASAAADFAANKTIALPKALGRALATYGSGSGLTARAMADIVGAETHALTEAEGPTHTHPQDSHFHGTIADSMISGDHAHSSSLSRKFSMTGSSEGTGSSFTGPNTEAATAINGNSGSGTPHNNMQPTLFLNTMIKL